MNCMNQVLEVSGTITNELPFISLKSQKTELKMYKNMTTESCSNLSKDINLPNQDEWVMKREKGKTNATTPYDYFLKTRQIEIVQSSQRKVTP